MKGGVVPTRNRPSVKLNINETSSETNEIESKSEPLIHPDIGKPIPTLSNFTHIPKEFQAKTYNVKDLTKEEKQKMFNEIRRQNPHIKSKNLFSKYYYSLRKQYEEIQSKQLQKSKTHLTRGDLHVLLPYFNVNIKPENLNSEEPISSEILKEIKRNSENYARRKIKELYNGYNMNNVNDTNVQALAADIDIMIGQLMNQYELEPLQISAVILARIMRMNMELGEADTFNQLMSTAINDDALSKDVTIQ